MILSLHRVFVFLREAFTLIGVAATCAVKVSSQGCMTRYLGNVDRCWNGYPACRDVEMSLKMRDDDILYTANLYSKRQVIHVNENVLVEAPC